MSRFDPFRSIRSIPVSIDVGIDAGQSDGVLVSHYRFRLHPIDRQIMVAARQDDLLGRLIAVETPNYPQLNETYAYDGSGNLLEKTIGDQRVTFTYDLANQLRTREIEGETTRYLLRTFLRSYFVQL